MKIIKYIIFYLRFSYRIKGSTNLPFEIKEIENINLFYLRPLLAILGYRGYKINSIILITRDDIKKGDYIRCIKLDETIYYGRLNT